MLCRQYTIVCVAVACAGILLLPLERYLPPEGNPVPTIVAQAGPYKIKIIHEPVAQPAVYNTLRPTSKRDPHADVVAPMPASERPVEPPRGPIPTSGSHNGSTESLFD